jgi:hypothetical protein
MWMVNLPSPSVYQAHHSLCILPNGPSFCYLINRVMQFLKQVTGWWNTWGVGLEREWKYVCCQLSANSQNMTILSF